MEIKPLKKEDTVFLEDFHILLGTLFGFLFSPNSSIKILIDTIFPPPPPVHIYSMYGRTVYRGTPPHTYVLCK